MSSVETVEKKPKSKKGGFRPGSGRKPLISREEIHRVKKLIEQHSVKIDPKDKKIYNHNAKNFVMPSPTTRLVKKFPGMAA